MKRVIFAAVTLLIVSIATPAVAQPNRPNACVGCGPAAPFCSVRTSGSTATAYCSGSTFTYKVTTNCTDNLRGGTSGPFYGGLVAQNHTSTYTCSGGRAATGAGLYTS